jgi:hypothetical protein
MNFARWFKMIERVLMPGLKEVKKESHEEKYGEYENNGHHTRNFVDWSTGLRFSS